jgi:hypothetical protein
MVMQLLLDHKLTYSCKSIKTEMLIKNVVSQ